MNYFNLYTLEEFKKTKQSDTWVQIESDTDKLVIEKKLKELEDSGAECRIVEQKMLCK